VIRSLSNSLCPTGRIHGRTHGCKGSLLKIRKGKFKRELGGCRWNLEANRACFSPPHTLKLTLFKTMGREEPGDFHPVINELGGA
jgi:hypothetical protein